MIVALLAILVLQKVLNIPNGVGVETKPLSSIMAWYEMDPYNNWGR